MTLNSAPSPSPSAEVLQQAAMELETLRRLSRKDDGYAMDSTRDYNPFPPACYHLLLSIDGNRTCIDCCGSASYAAAATTPPDWASVTYGCLMCLQCGGKHRSYGVKNSFVKSTRMDTWTYREVLHMLEGGNSQLESFFRRHRMGNDIRNGDFDDDSNNSTKLATTPKKNRYATKAAQYYRIHLSEHVTKISQLPGLYQGREVHRRQHHQQQRPQQEQRSDNDNVTATRIRRKPVASPLTSSSCSYARGDNNDDSSSTDSTSTNSTCTITMAISSNEETTTTTNTSSRRSNRSSMVALVTPPSSPQQGQRPSYT